MAKRLCKTLTLPNGTRKYIYAKTREELEKKYAQARLEVGAGVDISDRTTFGEFAQMWFNVFKKGKVSPHSESCIRSKLNQHLMPVLSDIEIRKINSMICSRVFTEMDSKGLCSDTQRSVYGLLKSIMDCAVDNNIIMRSPVTQSVKPLGKKRPSREALSTPEVEELLNTMRGGPISEYYMTLVALHTGMRIGEIMGLRWKNVDLSNRIIHVREILAQCEKCELKPQDHTKTQSGIRDIPYGDTIAKCFAELKLMGDSEYVFSGKDNGHMTLSNYVTYRNHLKAINPKCTPHVLRHTAITNWICNKGMDVKTAQYLAGHANVQVTYDIYTSYVKDSKFNETVELIRSFG